MENNGVVRVEIDLKAMQKAVPHQEQWLNQQLRNGGIPVAGVFKWGGVSSGALEIETDFTEDKLRFIWTPSIDKSPPE